MVCVLVTFHPAVLISQTAQALPATKTARVHGVVRDSQGKPAAGAELHLQAHDQSPASVFRANERGEYSFDELSPGVYVLRAESAESGKAEIGSLFLASGENKSVDLTLLPAKAASNQAGTAPEFFEAPQFTVAGVTDTTSLGGHGSDTVVRTRESIAKETASLSKPAATDETAVPAAAEKSLREKISREPKNAGLHHLLAGLDEKSGNSLEAVNEYQRAAELDAREPYWFDWGSELLLHHAPEPAAEVFSTGNRLFPKSVRMLVGLGAAWFARGDFEQAVRRVCEASDLDPADATPYLFLGKMQSAVAAPSAELIAKLQRFVRLHPDDADANYYYAVGLWKQRSSPPDPGMVAQVESLLHQAIHLDPGAGNAYLQLGVVRAAEKDLPGAIADFQQAIQAAPQLEEAHYRLALAYRQAGEAEKANAELKIYDRMTKESAEKTERERHEIRQFVYTLRDQPAATER